MKFAKNVVDKFLKDIFTCAGAPKCIFQQSRMANLYVFSLLPTMGVPNTYDVAYSVDILECSAGLLGNVRKKV